MKFKVTLRNKFNGNIDSLIIEAANEVDARYEADETYPDSQILITRPLRVIGEKLPKVQKPVYVRTQALRNRHERDLCNKQMKLGRYSPEAIEAEQAQLQADLQRELEA